MPRSSLINVPYTGLRTVESTAPPQAWQNIQVNEDMFGAAKGRALQQLGQAIGKFGEQVGAGLEKAQAEQDETTARKIDTQLFKDMTTIQTEYSMKNGEDAAKPGVFEEYDKKLQDAIANANKSAGGNKRVERLLGSSAEQKYKSAWSFGLKHKAKEDEVYKDGVSDARINQAIQSASVSGSEDDLGAAIDTINGETLEKGKRKGWGLDQLKVESFNRRSTAYSKFIGTMATRNPTLAQQYFDEYKFELHSDHRDQLNRILEDAHQGKVAPEVAREDARNGTANTQLPPRRGLPPPAVVAPPTGGAIRGPGSRNAPAPGMIQRGNINLDDRPVVKNDDGTISTERSFSQNIDGKEVLLPRIKEDGTVMTEAEAVAHYKQTGKHLGIFATPEAADKYAKDLSARQEKRHAPQRKSEAATDPMFGFKVRQDLSPSEVDYFSKNENVAGMATKDGDIVLNPFSPAGVNKEAVAKNEAFRLYLRQQKVTPDFAVTAEQKKAFAGTAYAKDEKALKETIAGRIYSGDPSAKATPEQKAWVEKFIGGGKRSEAEGPVQLASLVGGDTMSDAPPPGAMRLAARTEGGEPETARPPSGTEMRRFREEMKPEPRPGGKPDDDRIGPPDRMHGRRVAEIKKVEDIPEIQNIPDDWSQILGFGEGTKYKTPMDALKDVPDTHEAFIYKGKEPPPGVAARQEGDGYLVIRPRPGPKPEDLISGKDGRVRVAAGKGFAPEIPKLAPETPHDNKIMPGYTVTYGTMRDYVVQQARLRGIDPGTALAVVDSEGGAGWKSAVPGENSFGPFQLYTGNGRDSGGLGNKFAAAGHGNPADPNTWMENVEFALNNVIEGGWGPWNGAKKIGITGKTGVAKNARTIPVGGGLESVKRLSNIQEDLGEEPAAPVESRTIKGYIAEKQQGDPNAVARPGSRIIHAYNVPGRIRALPPDPQLEKATEAAAEAAGVKIRITSAGQTGDRNPATKDKPGGWTGSHRHTGGRAADVDILGEDGKVLSRNDPKRLKFLEEAAARGVGGTGAGYMDDTLKVHIGITGASGRVGEGLGAYAGNAEERAAVARGLEKGGYDASTRFVQREDGGGRVRYAALSSGTISDAPPPGYQAPGTQVAQAGGTSASTGPKVWGPVTHETTVEEINERVQQRREELQERGHNEKVGDSYERELKAIHADAIRAQADKVNKADKAIASAVYGDPEKGIQGVKRESDITNNPKNPLLREQWNTLDDKQKNAWRKVMASENAARPGRRATDADNKLYLGYDTMSRESPEAFTRIDFTSIDIDDGNRKKLINRQIQLKSGGDSAFEKRIREQVMGLPEVQSQMAAMQIYKPRKEEEREDPSHPYYIFEGALMAYVDDYRARNKGEVPTSDWIESKANDLLRLSAVKHQDFSLFSNPWAIIGKGKTEEILKYQVPEQYKAQMEADFKKSGIVMTPKRQREWLIRKDRMPEFLP